MVIDRYKLRLRKWLLEIMRDACRLEILAHRKYVETAGSPKVVTSLPRKPAPRTEVAYDPYGNPRLITIPPLADTIVPEPSFEQMQAESLEQQEKFYEPQR